MCLMYDLCCLAGRRIGGHAAAGAGVRSGRCGGLVTGVAALLPESTRHQRAQDRRGQLNALDSLLVDGEP